MVTVVVCPLATVVTVTVAPDSVAVVVETAVETTVVVLVTVVVTGRVTGRFCSVKASVPGVLPGHVDTASKLHVPTGARRYSCPLTDAPIVTPMSIGAPT